MLSCTIENRVAVRSLSLSLAVFLHNGSLSLLSAFCPLHTLHSAATTRRNGIILSASLLHYVTRIPGSPVCFSFLSEWPAMFKSSTNSETNPKTHKFGKGSKCSVSTSLTLMRSALLQKGFCVYLVCPIILGIWFCWTFPFEPIWIHNQSHEPYISCFIYIYTHIYIYTLLL